jgi:hypothetical protein
MNKFSIDIPMYFAIKELPAEKLAEFIHLACEYTMLNQKYGKSEDPEVEALLDDLVRNPLRAKLMKEREKQREANRAHLMAGEKVETDETTEYEEPTEMKEEDTEKELN